VDLAIQAQPTTYKGIAMRSRLEADWAATLDEHGIEWLYEPQLVKLPSGRRYLPDFWLLELRTVIEVKGVGVPGIDKPYELAANVAPDFIVIIGFQPLRRSVSPCTWESFIQWRDARGYDTRLAQCAACSAWQWLRPQLSRLCRICETPHQGFLVKPGEARFTHAPEPDALSFLRGMQ
jgi:hypothetical protein